MGFSRRKNHLLTVAVWFGRAFLRKSDMLESLREEVLEANLELVRHNLVIYTFGNASGINRESGLVVIKPSGVPYEKMTPQDLVVTDLDGRVVEGSLRPSSDLPTHLALFRSFPAIGGVVHTHSTHATAWAQARREIPCLGTTHADYFRGAVPVTEDLSTAEIQQDYEWNTGQAIVRRFASCDPLEISAVLVAGHGPFTWGTSPGEAAHNAVILEELAKMAMYSLAVFPEAQALTAVHRDKHFFRKHGSTATYGQK
jgi:L-ribulose-5-phosphate 4-epimerase